MIKYLGNIWEVETLTSNWSVTCPHIPKKPDELGPIELQRNQKIIKRHFYPSNIHA